MESGKMRRGVFSSDFYKKLVSVLSVSLVIIFFIIPIIRLIFMSFTADDGWTLAFYETILTDARTWVVIRNTVIMVLGSTVIATLLGTFFAWVIAYTDIRMKKLIQLFIFLPFIIPSYIISISWVEFFGQGGLLEKLLGIDSNAIWDLYSMSGIILVMGISHFPLVYLFSVHILRKIPREVELAAQISGASRWKSFVKIVLPMALPGIVGGSFIAFLGSLDNFGIPAFLGTPANIPVLSTYIYQQVIGFGTSAFHHAAVLSIILGFIAVIGLVFQSLILRKSKQMETTRVDYRVRYYLGKKKFVFEAIIWLFFILTSVLPLISMAMQSFVKAYGLDFIPSNFSLENYQYILKSNSTKEAILTSVKLAGVTAGVGILVGTIFAYLRVRKSNAVVKTMETAITIPYALPGMVLALAMIFAWMEPIPGWNPGIYGTSIILYIAYITRFLILQVRTGITAFQQIDIAVEEASRISGSNGVGKWRKILLPLIVPGVFSGAILVFLSALTELTVSSLLYSSETKTIGVSILSFQQSGYTLYSTAFSSMIVFLIIFGYILFYSIHFLWNRKVGNR